MGGWVGLSLLCGEYESTRPPDINIIVVILKVVSYVAKQRHCLQRGNYVKNATKKHGVCKTKFTAFSSMKTHRCTYQKKALELLKIAIWVRRLLE